MSGRRGEPGQPVVVVGEHHACGPGARGLVGDEVGERALDRFAVDVAAAGGGEDRDVGTQGREDRAPVAGRVLEQQRAVGGLEQVERARRRRRGRCARPTPASRCSIAAGSSAVARYVRELLHALLALLPGDAEVADAHLAGTASSASATRRRSAGSGRPTRRRRRRGRSARRRATQIMRSSGTPACLQDPHGLVAADQRRAGVGRRSAPRPRGGRSASAR